MFRLTPVCHTRSPRMRYRKGAEIAYRLERFIGLALIGTYADIFDSRRNLCRVATWRELSVVAFCLPKVVHLDPYHNGGIELLWTIVIWTMC